MDVYSEDMALLSDYELIKMPKVKDLVFDIRLTDTRKYILRRLIVEKSIKKVLLGKYFKHKKDVEMFVTYITEIHEIAKHNMIDIWLNPDWALETGLFRKKSTGDKK